TEVAVQFKRAPLPLFGDTGADEPNLLVLNIQPDEVISLQFVAKVPGLAMTLRPVTMGFRYGTAFGVEEMSAYERLLLDALLGDSTLFTRRDEVEEAWDLVEPLLNWWERSDPPEPVPMYAAGTWGPDAARALIARRGRPRIRSGGGSPGRAFGCSGATSGASPRTIPAATTGWRGKPC